VQQKKSEENKIVILFVKHKQPKSEGKIIKTLLLSRAKIFGAKEKLS
jgi:hypothetical protein